jgi:hypothetical protein
MNRRSLFCAGLVSFVMWYTAVALVTTGHTRLLWGVEHVVGHARRVVAADDGMIRRIEQDQYGFPTQS